MPSETKETEVRHFRKGSLPEARFDEFTADAKTLTDIALARKYDIPERTATNWRLRLVGPRNRTTPANDPAEITGA